MAAVDRNSDGSYDAVDSGGFGKDYHGQDAFGERIGGTGIGGSHFGGKAAGDFSGADELGEGHFTERYTDYGQAMATEVPDTSAFESGEEASSGLRDSLRDLNSNSSEENSNVGSLDTSMMIGENEDEKAKSSFTDKMEPGKSKELEDAVEKAKKEEEVANKALEKATEDYDQATQELSEIQSYLDKIAIKEDDPVGDKISKAAKSAFDTMFTRDIQKAQAKLDKLAKEYGIDVGDTSKYITGKGLAKGVETIKNAMEARKQEALTNQQKAQNATKEAKSNLDKYNSSFTDKMEESKEEAKAGPNMSKASVGESDYNTKANKDSTKKEGPSRNDFGNHATDTLKGVADRIADNTTAKALGIQSLEDFAKENGYDPGKLSTMKAYQIYQNKQIMKAIPGIIKQVGSYITERIKDAFDPSQLPERIRNTLARYNAATLVGAAILSIQSGAGLQASIDQALTMVDPEDQPTVSDYLEDVLNDEGVVADLSNAFDDALAPEQNSDTAELDESIVNIGRKDNTDYSGFNAGLGTTSDADVKVFIARNIHSDPILRRMISKMGK